MSYIRRIVLCSTGTIALAIGAFPALRAEAAPLAFGAVASANQEVSAPAAGDINAAAVVDLSIDGVTGDICVQSSLSGLGGAITAAHIHSGAFGVNGPVVVPLPNTATSVSGCVVTTPQQAQAILASPSSFYFNAHTSASPGGALRGQITATMFSASLFGATEVPGPGDPDGSGRSIVAVDTLTNRACVWTDVAAIDLPAAAAHIHAGAAGVGGPVVLPITAPALATAASCGSASATVIAGIVSAPTGFYVNVHTSTFPNGAVRGNLAVRTSLLQAIPTAGPIVLTPSTAPATSTTVAPVATTTTLASPTTTTTTTTTIVASPTTVPATTAVAAVEPAPAEPIEAAPTFAG